jgi:hypothetical protein
MILKKILLTYYPVTRARLELARIPLGMSITRWINSAICEKLDREQPETILEVAPVEASPVVAPDTDFWGEDEADKVRALVKRHTR